MAPDNEVNKFNIDGTTSLTTLYHQTIEQKTKYTDITKKKEMITKINVKTCYNYIKYKRLIILT